MYGLQLNGCALDSLSAIERVKVTGELSAKSAAIATASAIQKIGIGREILALIARLSGDAQKPVRLSFSLNDKEASAASLSAYLDAGMPGLSDAVSACEEETVALLAQQLGNKELAQRAQAHAADRGIPQFHMNKTRIAVYEEFAGRGVKIDLEPAAVLSAHQQLQEEMKRGAYANPQYAEAKKACDEYLSSTQDRMRDLVKRINALEQGEEAVADKLAAEYNHLRNVEYPVRAQELADAANAAAQAWGEDLKKRLHETLAAPGERLIGAILDASPVTEQEAVEWARRQIIDDDARAKLKRIKYPPEQVIADMAEFYRLTGGKASAIRLSTNRARRAHAVGVTTAVGEKTIVMDGDFNKVTLFHELAHFLENDPVALAASNGFLLKRRDDEKVYRLRDLTGHKGYRSDEIAYKDSWLNPYIGKVYQDGVTECFAMAVQYLAKPEDAALLAAKDPEMFAYVTGYLSAPLTPAMQAKLHMHDTAIGDLKEQRATEEELYGKAIKQLAATVTITDDGWFVPGHGYAADSQLKYLAADGKMPEFLGSAGNFRVFAGTFKNIATGRRTKCHMVAQLDDQFRELGWLSSSDWAPIVGGMDYVKAFIAVCRQRQAENGDPLRRIFYDSFYEAKGSKSKKPVVIRAAGIEKEGVPA